MSKSTQKNPEISLGLAKRFSYVIGVSREGVIVADERVRTVRKKSRSSFDVSPRTPVSSWRPARTRLGSASFSKDSASMSSSPTPCTPDAH